MSELLGVTCHMGSHNVTYHPTQVNAPHRNPSKQVGTRFDLPIQEECEAELTSVLFVPRWFTCPIQVAY